MAQIRKRIIVLGGYGAIGTHVCAAVSRLPYVDCVVAGRSLRKARRVARQLTATTLQIDAEDAESLEGKLSGAFMVIDLAGSFQRRSPAVARYCAQNGIHYVDLSDDRAYTAQLLKLDAQARRGGSVVVTGAGSLPGLASILVDSMRSQFSSIDEIHAHVTLGAAHPHGEGSAASLLTNLGSAIRVKRRGRWSQAVYWTQAQRIQFPDPVGRRRTWLVDVPAADVFAQHYEAQTIEFHVGTHSPLLNGLLVLLRKIRRADKTVSPTLARFAAGLARVGGFHGGDTSGIVVFIKGVENGDVVTHSVALVEKDGADPGMVTSLLKTLVQHWTEAGAPDAGAVGAVGLLSLDEMKPALIEHGVRLVRA
jgi:hypothetical protein